MLTALTDLITCPRCGPAYGLILLPDAVTEGRVEAGVLGCANCRERYPIEGGIADLREASGEGPEADGKADERAGDAPGADGAVRLGALLGLAEGGGPVLLAGPAARHAGELSRLVERADVVAVGTGRIVGVSSLRLGDVIPFRNGAFGAVALTGAWSERVEEGARVLAPAGRLLLDPAPSSAGDRVRAAGLDPLLEEGGVLVAGR